MEMESHDIFYCIEKGMKADTVVAVEKLFAGSCGDGTGQ